MKSNNNHQNTNSLPGWGKRPCKLVRRRLFGRTSGRHDGLFTGLLRGSGIDLETPWVHEHIASCPRCQRRFSALNRVNMTLALLKSRPHAKHLLSQANSQTINVLQHKLRETDKAQTLRTTLPDPSVRDRIWLARHSLAHVAACVAVLLLSKIGIFSTIKHSQVAGHKAVRHLYASHLDSDTTDEIFPQS